MIKEKKLVPKRRFKEYEDNKPLQVEYLGTLTDIKTGPFGSSLHAKDYVEEGIPIITTEHFKEGYLPRDKQGVPQVSNEDFLRLNAYKLQSGDIVFSRVGSVDVNALATGVQNGWLFSGRVLRVRPQEQLSSLYLHYLLDTKRVKQDVVARAVGQTMPSINTEILNQTKIIRTSNNKEQQKIGEFFKVLDERIANQKRKIAKVKALKSAYLTEMFPQEGETVPKRRFKGFEGEWNETILDSVLAYEQPTDYIVDEDSYDDSYDIPVLTAGQSFLLGYTNEKHGIKKADVNNSVIIFDDFTTSSHHVDFFFKVKSSALKILSSNSRKYSTYFAYLILKNIDYTPESHERHWISIFSNFEVMTPSMEEQQKIGEFFKNLDNQIRLEEKKLDKIQKMKEAYLEEMFV
ncbi:restriction endonuclease subunit S [Paraliobacillus ryukyuensis]|uniref:restriction endonuclease subunit S n=1 Tax=Paraliobacillus ryukyuensis TaxID=200904 RepID=UPI0009A6040B|nr:restriction endonuclease subunit S [Paraliobacillus ryukyuensis]